MLSATLQRRDVGPGGAFSTLTDAEGSILCLTCEHTYRQDDGTWTPKIPPGIYTCRRGTHQLEGGDPFQTFEVTGIDGHSGLLFHKGNTEADSHGCILVGMVRGLLDGQPAVLKSALAFDRLMAWADQDDEFLLTVK